MEVTVNNDETLDDLQIKGIKIIQKKNGFRYGIDSVLLANFADVRKNERVFDIGTGTGVIPLIIAAKTEASEVVGIEIQERLCETANRNVIMNHLEGRIKIICADVRTFSGRKKQSNLSGFDVVVTNPPYMNKGGGLLNASDEIAAARHEILCSLEDVIITAKQLLAPGGQFAMVHRPSRLVDIITVMRKYDIEPKFIRFVYPNTKKEPNLVLIKGFKNGKAFLKIMKPLFVYNENGKYTNEIENIYNTEVSGRNQKGMSPAASSQKSEARSERSE
jgi:tRNA1Val (adenine37-N6)-methyltransferase